MSKVAVVILNWNGKNWLEKFLPNVIHHSTNNFTQIVVADNASTDDSVAFVTQNFPTVQVIEMKVNTGYAGGYNEALQQLNADYFVLLNSDIEVTENWLHPVIDLMDANQHIAACQPKILAYNQKDSFEYAGASGGIIDAFGYPFCRGRVFDTLEKDLGQYDDAQSVFWATGACLFVRARSFKEVGGLDADFFAHMEEIDLCWRLQNLGYQIWVAPKSVVYHVGGGTLPQGNPRKTMLNFRNSLLMLLKNLPWYSVVPVIFTRLVLDGIAGVQALFNGNMKDIGAIIKAHFYFYWWMPKYLMKRWKAKKTNATKLQGKYSGSIVWAYFIGGKKTFTSIFGRKDAKNH